MKIKTGREERQIPVYSATAYVPYFNIKKRKYAKTLKRSYLQQNSTKVQLI